MGKCGSVSALVSHKASVWCIKVPSHGDFLGNANWSSRQARIRRAYGSQKFLSMRISRAIVGWKFKITDYWSRHVGFSVDHGGRIYIHETDPTTRRYSLVDGDDWQIHLCTDCMVGRYSFVDCGSSNCKLCMDRTTCWGNSLNRCLPDSNILVCFGR